MYKNALLRSFNLNDLFKTIKYKSDFAKSHPNFFRPCGTAIFCGAQGYGKTLSAVNYVLNVCTEFPFSVLVSNVSLKSRPFNAYVVPDCNGNSSLFSLKDGSEITSDTITSGQHSLVTVEYWGLDSLKYVNNGEYGVIYLIDELHLELNSLESKNIDISVMVEISQQRKQRKHIVGTSQIFMRLAKPLREQIKDVVLCQNFIGSAFQWNKHINGETAVEENGKLKADVIGRSWFFHSSDMYDEYDTFAKMKRYNEEWQGVKPINQYKPLNDFFERGNI